jgi:hypothetical protein
MSDGTLGALTLQANGNKELDYDRELAELFSKEVKANMGAGSEVISKKSTDPETAALEEKMKEEFGVRVRFGDDSNLSFAKQIYNLCTTLKQLGHKFPNEIVLCEAAEDKSYCAGFTIKEDQRGAIVCIATVDPVNNKMGFTVGHSFKDALLHELGHVNCNESNSDANSESPSIESLGEIVDSAILELASTQSQDGANRQPWKEKLQATIKVAYESEGLSNICESRTVFACLSDLPEKQYIDLWHTVAERVKFAASAMENSPQKRVIDEVSVYASFSPFELVAEVYCGRMLGKTYSNEIMEMYSKFGGVPLD